MSEDEIAVSIKQSTVTTKKRRPKKIAIPKRQPSLVAPTKVPVFVTADKTTCGECQCYPKEDPYVKNKKLNACPKSPKALYEISAKVVDGLSFPEAVDWSEEEVATWMVEDVGLPQYKDSILNNRINGMRLLMLEDPSKLAAINVKEFKHMQEYELEERLRCFRFEVAFNNDRDFRIIAKRIRQIFGTEFIRFSRSIDLPPRKPLTHCTFFKSRTGPSWGIRRNWTRCDILRWMKMIMPEPIYLDHWDLVWYQKPDYPKVKFARIGQSYPITYNHIPHYVPKPDVCREYLAPRKFIIQENIPREEQRIWMEMIPEREVEKEEKEKKTKPKKSRLMPKKINLTGLTGKEFILARRKMAKPKFLP